MSRDPVKYLLYKGLHSLLEQDKKTQLHSLLIGDRGKGDNKHYVITVSEHLSLASP